MIDPSRDRARWKQLLREAQVRDGRLHDACHDAARAGRRPSGRTESLGHSQITPTQNTHQHVMPRVVADATQWVAAVLFVPTATTTAPAPETQEPLADPSPQVRRGASELPHLDSNQEPFD